MLVRWADVVAVGPGLGESEAMPNLLATLFGRAGKPLIVDADGLNALAKLPRDLWRTRHAPVVVTPHPGEFARLTGRTSAEIQAQRQDIALEYAARFDVTLVLKGHGTLVTDGRRLYRNSTGNPGMATGGTGDVLTGLIAALVGQKLDVFEAAVLGTWRMAGPAIWPPSVSGMPP